MVTRAITRAQKKVEAYNFEIRKNLLEYDEVMDIQRKEVYGLRQAVLAGDDERLRTVIEDMIGAVVEVHAKERLGRDVPSEERRPEELAAWFRKHFGVDAGEADAGPDAAEATEKLTRIATERWKRREQELGVELMRRIERFLLLNSIDSKWKDHLRAMDGLKSGVGLRGYGQMDPKVEYKVEGHAMFSQMIRSIREEVTDMLLKVRLREEDEEHLADRWGGAQAVAPPPPPTGVSATTSTFTAPPEAPPPGLPPPPRAVPPPPRAAAGAPAPRGAPPSLQGANRPPTGYEGAREGRPIGSEGAASAGPIRRDQPKVGRNDPCPCGSGKKYKKCHGQDA
jgi:preprotein translocase subunit SecA